MVSRLPWSVTPDPPLLVAICAAVLPLPYRFEASVWLVDTVFEAVTPLLGAHVVPEPLPPVVHDVPFAVLLAGFTPACADVLEFALLLLDAVVVDDALLWPGAFAELPPLPLPANAEAVNAVRASVRSTAPTAAAKPAAQRRTAVRARR